MNNIRYEVDKELVNINDNFDTSNDKKRLVGTANLLRFVANTQGLRINIPKKIQKEIDKFEKQKYKKDKDFVEYYEDNYKLNYDFAKMAEIINSEFDLLDDHNYVLRINQTDTINIVKDFFKYYDINIYNYFNNLLSSNRVFFVKKLMEDIEGLTIEKTQISKPYIFVYNDKNIKNPISMAHEVIHAYLSEKFLYMSDEERKLYDLNNFEETYSSFIELAMIDYFNLNKYFKEDIESYIDEYNDVMLDDLYNYFIELECNEIDFSDEEDVYIYTKFERYAYGRTLAYHFYRKYMNNKIEAKDNILQFMLDSMKYNKNYMLNNYGLNTKRITDEKRLVRYMNFDD